MLGFENLWAFTGRHPLLIPKHFHLNCLDLEFMVRIVWYEQPR